MRGFLTALLLGLLAGGDTVGADDVTANPALDFFEASVRPLLVNHCQSCHGEAKQEKGLRLDSRQAVLAGGESGAAIEPGDPEKSLLIKAVHYSDNLQMPPKGKLEEAEIEILVHWVKLGAPWTADDLASRAPPPEVRAMITPEDREFWSFRAMTDAPLPTVRNAAWPQSSLDTFILAALEAQQLAPAAPADKHTLLRRATFDLTGLPPTVGEIDAFLHDESPLAFEHVVDRLLASPAYGERWGRHWLDVARYGEDQAHTFEAKLYPQGFRYRAWVVSALNRDLPYDQFVTQQIAADLLPGEHQKEQLAALGFFAMGPVYYGDKKKLDQFDDRIDTLTRGFLGLTVACARCHDHKYDPISTEDYYALAGVFSSTDYAEIPLVPQAEVEAAEKALTEEQKKKKVHADYPYIHAVADASQTVNMQVHIRGSADNLGNEVPRRFLSILCDDEPASLGPGSGRLQLAQAITDPHNPLTARVIVNRVWQHHFGRGLVGTPSNFGRLGERPTHPELLDHLASRFIESGWSLKQLHRDIMRSATYQQSGADNSAAREVDADNRLLWHMPPRRLEVEAWRDAMLAVAGTLDTAIGGESFDLANVDQRRRTLYGFVSRHNLNPLLRLFDFPDPNITSDERSVTTVPLQQLFVLNSEFMVRTARDLAERVQAHVDDEDGRLRYAFQLVYGREITMREMELARAFLSTDDDSRGEDDTTPTKWQQYAQVLLSANEFLFID